MRDSPYFLHLRKSRSLLPSTHLGLWGKAPGFGHTRAQGAISLDTPKSPLCCKQQTPTFQGLLFPALGPKACYS